MGTKNLKKIKMGNHYAANNNFLTKKCAFTTNIF